MTLAHAQYWDQRVWPTVKRIELERIVGIRPRAQPRADAYWRIGWVSQLRTFSFLPRVPSGPSPVRVRGTTPHLWTVLASGNGPAPVPIGMLMGLSNFPMSAGAPAGTHKFAWLLTTAPEEHLQAEGIPGSLAIGRVLLDLVIQISLATGSSGRALLHADPRGGQGLMKFYASSLMQSLDPTAVPKISALRPNDGRYFHFDVSHAGQFALKLHRFRRGQLGTLPSTAAPIKV